MIVELSQMRSIARLAPYLEISTDPLNNVRPWWDSEND